MGTELCVAAPPIADPAHTAADLSWLQELEKPGRRSNSRSDKPFYSLTEAAEITKRTPRNLLSYGSLGEISFVTPVPWGIEVCAVDSFSAHTGSPMFQPELMQFPEMLVVSPRDCRRIETSTHGLTEQSDFSEGYTFDVRGKPQMFPANVGAPVMHRGGWAWRTFQHGDPVTIELAADRLWVLHSDLVKLIASEATLGEPARGTVKTRQADTPDLTRGDAQRSTQEIKRPFSDHFRRKAESGRQEARPKDTIVANLTADQHENHSQSPPKHPKIIRAKDVIARTGLSRSTVYAKIDPKSPCFDATFPKQVRLGPNAVGWVETEIDAWIESRRSCPALRRKKKTKPTMIAAPADE